MKKLLPLWIILGILLLLLGGAGWVLSTAVHPLTVEAGAPAPAPADYGQYALLSLTGDVPPDTAHPGTQTVTLRLFGIPLTTTLTVADTTPPTLTAHPQRCFVDETLPIEAFAEVRDVTEVRLDYVTAPDFTQAGEQTVRIRATDLGGNTAEIDVPLTVRAVSYRLTAEAGITSAALKAKLTDAIEGKLALGDALAQVDTAKLGEQQLRASLDGEEIRISLTVEDTVAPTATPQMVSILRGQTAAPEAFLREVADVTAVKAEFAARPDFSPGVRSVEIRLTDEGGNTTSVSAVLRVHAAPAEVILEYGDDPDSMIEQMLQGSGLTLSAAAEALLRDPTRGTHTVTLINTRNAELTQTVTIADTTPPAGEGQNRTAYVGDTLEAADFVREIRDATAVTVAYADGAPDLQKPGSRSVRIRLTDEAGNETILTAALTVVADTEPPVLYGVTDRTVYIGESVSYRSGVSAWDNRDGTVSVKADASGVNLRTAGSYPVIYTATDAAGNTAAKTVTITVIDADTAALKQIADGVLAKILRDGMTERERLWAIYDWSVKNLRYVAYPDKTDPVAAAFYGFRQGRGDCFVYYAVTRILLTQAGIENLEIHRNIPDKPHFWNLVKFEGNWYHLDTCPHYAAHPLTCFLLTDAEVKAYSENHVADYYSFDASLYPPTP